MRAQRVSADDAPQVGDVDVERVGGGRRRLLLPQVVHQPVARDRLVRVKEQVEEQQALLPAGDRQLTVAVAERERAEQEEVQGGRLLKTRGKLILRCGRDPCRP